MNAEERQKQWELVSQQVISYDFVDRSQATAFLSQLQPQAMSDGFLMLTAETDFIRNWIESHYGDVIKQALLELFGIPYTVAFEVNPNQKSDFAPRESEAEKNVESSTVETTVEVEAESGVASSSSNDEVVCDSSSATAKPQHSPIMPTSSLTFESFVVGASNQMAYSMALAVAEDPGRPLLNPLFIYGRPGLGKTHLMRAIQNHVSEQYPELTATYVDSADLVNQYVEASVAHDKEKSSYKNFKNSYQEADVLLIDDVQYLQNKTQTLDIIFQIFNHLVDQGKQVVLSADRAPKNIDIDERYQSRFNSGATFDIQPPEIETKLAIIKSLVDEYAATFDNKSFKLSEDIMEHIADISGPNIRELKSAVTKVIYTQNSLGGTEITKEKVSETLSSHFTGGSTKKLEITDIQREVEQYFDVSHSDLIGQKRVREINYARQVAIYLSREMLSLPYTYIAQSFGGRDHSTIMHAVKTIEEKLKTNRDVAEEIENIQRNIRNA